MVASCKKVIPEKRFLAGILYRVRQVGDKSFVRKSSAYKVMVSKKTL
jgi:hypothetical protein